MATSVKYAPEDPTLPKPWKGLVDTNTGYLYFWNPVTNVTQYDKPAAPSNAGSAPPRSSLSSSVQKSQGPHSKYDDENRYNQGSNDNSSTKVDSGPGANQVPRVAHLMFVSLLIDLNKYRSTLLHHT